MEDARATPIVRVACLRDKFSCARCTGTGNDAVLVPGEPQFAIFEGYTEVKQVLLAYQTASMNNPPTVSRWVSDVYGAHLTFCVCIFTPAPPTKNTSVPMIS